MCRWNSPWAGAGVKLPVRKLFGRPHNSWRLRVRCSGSAALHHRSNITPLSPEDGCSSACRRARARRLVWLKPGFALFRSLSPRNPSLTSQTLTLPSRQFPARPSLSGSMSRAHGTGSTTAARVARLSPAKMPIARRIDAQWIPAFSSAGRPALNLA